ncbi:MULTISPECIES: SGNH/GDSL hydrolase family protein [Arthrobacter]|uniref:SGNH/GDSL hydrolase family protein n=1 Tax=Arthrobacter TaxID=1663 RepID=UPI0014054C88|nr:MULTISPECIES: SGNH/GDSL hydrolase family protein [Arthrobacter]MBT8162779.1 SGNH/GDSL hydrolase family protein [Arthrobacter sp. GN70]
MKRLALITAAVAALALSGCAQTPPPVSEKVQQAYDANKTLTPQSPPVDPLAKGRANGSLSVYFIGDSLTDGWNATTQPQAFRPRVVQALQKGGPVDATAVYKAGANTATVAAMSTPPASPGLVIVELGTNDVNKTDIGKFGTDYAALLDSLNATKPVLVCVGTWQFGTTMGFDSVIESACEARGGRFVKIGDIRENPAMVAVKGSSGYPDAADGNHPNDAGHTEIARRIVAALTP